MLALLVDRHYVFWSFRLQNWRQPRQSYTDILYPFLQVPFRKDSSAVSSGNNLCRNPPRSVSPSLKRIWVPPKAIPKPVIPIFLMLSIEYAEHADQPRACCKTQEKQKCGTCGRSARAKKEKSGSVRGGFGRREDKSEQLCFGNFGSVLWPMSNVWLDDNIQCCLTPNSLPNQLARMRSSYAPPNRSRCGCMLSPCITDLATRIVANMELTPEHHGRFCTQRPLASPSLHNIVRTLSAHPMQSFADTSYHISADACRPQVRTTSNDVLSHTYRQCPPSLLSHLSMLLRNLWQSHLGTLLWSFGLQPAPPLWCDMAFLHHEHAWWMSIKTSLFGGSLLSISNSPIDIALPISTKEHFVDVGDSGAFAEFLLNHERGQDVGHLPGWVAGKRCM